MRFGAAASRWTLKALIEAVLPAEATRRYQPIGGAFLPTILYYTTQRGLLEQDEVEEDHCLCYLTGSAPTYR